MGNLEEIHSVNCVGVSLKSFVCIVAAIKLARNFFSVHIIFVPWIHRLVAVITYHQCSSATGFSSS